MLFMSDMIYVQKTKNYDFFFNKGNPLYLVNETANFNWDFFFLLKYFD